MAQSCSHDEHGLDHGYLSLVHLWLAGPVRAQVHEAKLRIKWPQPSAIMFVLINYQNGGLFFLLRKKTGPDFAGVPRGYLDLQVTCRYFTGR